MIKLSKRLSIVASLIDSNNIIDVGCDHALLDIYLAQINKNRKIIVSDINENALKNAKENIKKYKLSNQIEARLGSGLDTLTEENIDTLVISGLGSHTIVGILHNNIFKLKNIKNIIIQSNTNLNFLREKVTKLNYYIDEEIQVKENNIIYTIIKFVKGKKRYSKKELYFGPILLKKNDDLFKEYNELEKKKLENLMRLIPKSNYRHRLKIYFKLRMYR